MQTVRCHMFRNSANGYKHANNTITVRLHGIMDVLVSDSFVVAFRKPVACLTPVHDFMIIRDVFERALIRLCHIAIGNIHIAYSLSNEIRVK